MVRSIFALAAVLSVAAASLALGAGAAFAAVGGLPGPPHVTPVSPCISTGFLQEDDTSIGSFSCSVRNVGVVSHNVTIDIRDGGNLTDGGFAHSVSLAPGHGTLLSFSPHKDFTAFDACVVTTDEGTTDALQDLRVVMQFSSPTGETEGTIFGACALSEGVSTLP
jgi:hypothetical protein